MSYGKIQSTYNIPLAKFNTTRSNYSYHVFPNGVFILNTISCPLNFNSIGLYNWTDYLNTSIPFSFETITNNCSSSSINFNENFGSLSPIVFAHGSVTGGCNVNLEDSLPVINLSPASFSFTSVTTFCSNSIELDTTISYTPAARPAALTGLYNQEITNSCLKTVDASWTDYLNASTPFSFTSITNSCSRNSLSANEDFGFISSSAFAHGSVTGGCNVNLEDSLPVINLSPVSFSFISILNSCNISLE
jgi:hypothetical protein